MTAKPNGHPARRFFDPDAQRLPTGHAPGWRRIEALRPELGERATNALLRNGYTYAHDVATTSDEQLLAGRAVGRQVLDKVRDVIGYTPPHIIEIVRTVEITKIVKADKPQTPRRKRKSRNDPMPDDKHGTAVGYEYYKCRCGACCAAASERWAKYPKRGTKRKAS